MIVCSYAKSKEDVRYINCIEKINDCMFHLKKNCNFDMSIDTMIFEMWECIQKGI